VSCKDSIIPNDSPTETPEEEEELTNVPVLFSTSGEIPNDTRAGQIRLMPNNIRFSAMMLTKDSKRSDYRYNHGVYANLLVEDSNEGNCLYTKETYVLPSLDQNNGVYLYRDNYRNDKDANVFYWANRLNHVFIGYIDDYNKALSWATNRSNPKAATTNGVEVISTTKPYTPTDLSKWDLTAPTTAPEGKHFLYAQTNEESPIYRWQQYEEFSLINPIANSSDETQSGTEMRTEGTFGEAPVTTTQYVWEKIEDMPDPLVALTETAPVGGTAEANRVHLVFRHQLSQVQVNLKGSDYGGGDIKEEYIKGADLWGIAEKVRVFPYPEYGYESADGASSGESIKMIAQTDNAILRKAEAEPIKLGDSKYNSTIELNPYGSSFSMFQMTTPSTGYLRSFEAIAFGTLEAIRIHWDEHIEGSTEIIPHDITYKVTQSDMKQLVSGKRYIFNFELRRGTLAVIKADIEDWIPYEEDGYHADGVIVN